MHALREAGPNSMLHRTESGPINSEIRSFLFENRSRYHSFFDRLNFEPIRLGETASRLLIDPTAIKKHPKHSFLAGLDLQRLTRSLLSSRGPTKGSLRLLRCESFLEKLFAELAI